jgi:hypothetical protein
VTTAIPSREHVAERLAALADRAAPGPGQDALVHLAQVLAARPGDLAGVDLVQAYPPEVLLPDHRRETPRWQRILRGTEIFRDVLVFVPVAVTWWQLRSALEAYQTAGGGESFLLGWQRGFGGAVTPLGESARVVALAVLFVIGLTLGVHAAHRVPSSLSRQNEREELGGLLAVATLLTSAGSAGPPVTAKDLSRLAPRLGTASTALASALEKTTRQITEAVDSGPGSRLHEAIVEWTATARELRRTTEALATPAEAVKTLEELQKSMHADSRGLQERIGVLVGQLEAATQKSEAEAQSHREIAQEVARSAERLGETLEVFRERTESLSELVERLRYALDRLDSPPAVYDSVMPLGNAGPPGEHR